MNYVYIIQIHYSSETNIKLSKESELCIHNTNPLPYETNTQTPTINASGIHIPTVGKRSKGKCPRRKAQGVQRVHGEGVHGEGVQEEGIHGEGERVTWGQGASSKHSISAGVV